MSPPHYSNSPHDPGRRKVERLSSSPEPYRHNRPRQNEVPESDRHTRRRRSEGSEPHRQSKRRRSGERREKYAARHRTRDSTDHDSSRRDRSRSPRRRRRRTKDSGDRHRERDDSLTRSAHDRHPDARHSNHTGQARNDEREPWSKSSRPLPSQTDAFQGGPDALVSAQPLVEKEKPNFSTTGQLAAESNTIKSSDGKAIVLKYHEPPEARKPAPGHKWRMYVFKGSDILETIELSQQSCWLFGREASVVDILIEHPSSSKQHAVVQFRHVETRNEFGDKKSRVKPYLIDLESANGTMLNGTKVPPGRYLELRDKDEVGFGHSTRQYMIQLPP
jgi:smad nuclear-interacting protein 1